jgi:hypothetical protein
MEAKNDNNDESSEKEHNSSNDENKSSSQNDNSIEYISPSNRNLYFNSFKKK